MEYDLNILANGRQPQFFVQMKDDINLIVNGIQPQSHSNGRQLQKLIMQPKTIKNKTMVVAPLRVT